MAIKIVADSSADLPAKLVEELGITVVPLYVRFGEEIYRDKVDIFEEQFYQRLQHDPTHPTTIQPSPQDFAEAYQKVAAGADGIVSIHISGKLSGTCNAAAQAREMLKLDCPIEIIDSQETAAGLMLIVTATAAVAQSGGNLTEVVEAAKQATAETHQLCVLDTLKYLLLGGRIGKAKALLGSILSVKPLITLRDGEVVPAGQARTIEKGIDRLVEFAQNTENLTDVVVAYNTTPEKAEKMTERIGAFFPRERIKIATIGPMLGVHVGPGALIIAVRGETKK